MHKIRPNFSNNPRPQQSCKGSISTTKAVSSHVPPLNLEELDHEHSQILTDYLSTWASAKIIVFNKPEASNGPAFREQVCEVLLEAAQASFSASRSCSCHFWSQNYLSSSGAKRYTATYPLPCLRRTCTAATGAGRAEPQSWPAACPGFVSSVPKSSNHHQSPPSTSSILTTSQEVNAAFPQQAVTTCSCTQTGCLNSWSLRGGQSGNQRKIIPLVFHHVSSFLLSHLMRFTSRRTF